MVLRVFLEKLEHLRGQGDDLHEVLLTKFAGNGSENTGAAWIEILVNDDDGIVVKAQVGTILAADRLAGSDDDGTDNLALLDGSAGGGLLDVGGDDVTDTGGEGPLADNADHCGHAGAGVVSDIEA